MIIGTGVDIVAIERIRRALRLNPRLAKRILTEAERGQLPENPRRQAEYISGRFAAKEALAKALGTGIGRHFSWQDVSVLKKENGEAEIVFHHERFFAPEWQRRKVHLSLAHERHYAVAFILIEEG